MHGQKAVRRHTNIGGNRLLLTAGQVFQLFSTYLDSRSVDLRSLDIRLDLVLSFPGESHESAKNRYSNDRVILHKKEKSCFGPQERGKFVRTLLLRTLLSLLDLIKL